MTPQYATSRKWVLHVNGARRPVNVRALVRGKKSFILNFFGMRVPNLQDLAIHWGFYIPEQNTIVSKDDLIKRTGPKTDPWGTPDRARNGSDARPSNTTF